MLQEPMDAYRVSRNFVENFLKRFRHAHKFHFLFIHNREDFRCDIVIFRGYDNAAGFLCQMFLNWIFANVARQKITELRMSENLTFKKREEGVVSEKNHSDSRVGRYCAEINSAPADEKKSENQNVYGQVRFRGNAENRSHVEKQRAYREANEKRVADATDGVDRGAHVAQIVQFKSIQNQNPNKI